MLRLQNTQNCCRIFLLQRVYDEALIVRKMLMDYIEKLWQLGSEEVNKGEDSKSSI